MIVYTFKFGQLDSFVRRTFSSKTVAERERRKYARVLNPSSRDERTWWLNTHPLETVSLDYKHEIVEFMEDISNEHRNDLNKRIGVNYWNG